MRLGLGLGKLIGLWLGLLIEGLQSVYKLEVRIVTTRICIHLQKLKADKIPNRVWNSPVQLVTAKVPANTMKGIARWGCGMCRKH